MNEVQQLFPVRTYDIDFAGVLNNVVYVRWLEDLRGIFADGALPLAEAYSRGIVPTISRTEVDYLAPVRYPDTIEGPMGMLEHGRARFVLWAEFRSHGSGIVTVRARQTGVFVHLDTLRPVPLPPEFQVVRRQ